MIIVPVGVQLPVRVAHVVNDVLKGKPDEWRMHEVLPKLMIL